MAAILPPVRLDRVQQGIFDLVRTAVDPTEVHWDYTEPAFEQLPAAMVGLRMIGGPGAWIRKGKRGTVLTPITSVVLTVASVLVGKRYIIVLNDHDFFTDAVGGDTVDTIRDRLRDLITADGLDATAVDAGAGAITLAQTSLGSIRSLALVGSLTAAAPTVSSASVLLLEGTRTMLINAQAFSKTQEPFGGAWSVISQVEEALMTEDLIQDLTALGVLVWGKTAPIDLSAIAGAHWETRASMDFTLSARSYSVRPVDTIETVDVDLTAKDVDGTTLATSTITVVSP
jgi:hypothetical protein